MKSMKARKSSAPSKTAKRKKSVPVKPSKKPPPPKPTKKSKKASVCVPDRVKIVSGPLVSTGDLNLPSYKWQSGFVVLRTAAHIRGFRFLCETIETSADADLAFGVTVLFGDGGSVTQNSFLECHRGVSMTGSSSWNISNNFFTIGSSYSDANYISGLRPQASCDFVRLSGASRENIIDSNTGIVTGNTVQDDRYAPCAGVALAGVDATPLTSFPAVPLLVQGTQITNNNFKSTSVSVGRAVGVYATAASFSFIAGNQFDSLTYDVWFDWAASRNTVYDNEFDSTLVDSIRINGGAFANNITSNTIDSPGGIGVYHVISQAVWGASGAEVITDNSVLRSTGCGFTTPDPASNPFALPDILYNNYGNMCTY